MSEPTMPWEKLKTDGRDRGFLGKQLYAVNTVPVNGLGPVLAVLDEHAKYQVHLEEIGVMWAAGPFANDAGDAWDGEGFFVYRADSLEEAIKYAKADPMHSSGARSFRVRTWLLNEGSFHVRVNYSTGKADIM
jgi:uncharacterized protein YciI